MRQDAEGFSLVIWTGVSETENADPENSIFKILPIDK